MDSSHSGPHFTLTIALAAEGAGTRLSWRQEFDFQVHHQAVRDFAVPANWGADVFSLSGWSGPLDHGQGASGPLPRGEFRFR